MPTPPEPQPLPPDKQALLDNLLDQNSEGTISAEDKAALVDLVAEAERLIAENSKRLAEFAQAETPTVPANAMPVTVWVKPSSTE